MLSQELEIISEEVVERIKYHIHLKDMRKARSLNRSLIHLERLIDTLTEKEYDEDHMGRVTFDIKSLQISFILIDEYYKDFKDGYMLSMSLRNDLLNAIDIDENLIPTLNHN